MTTEPAANTPALPSPQSGWGVLGSHLLQVPGAVAAIARLVGKTAELATSWIDIPVAEGQRRAQVVRDDQAARTAMLAVVQEAAAGKAIQDPELLQRAVSSFVDDRLRKQTNREAVAEEAIQNLKVDPPAADAPGPTDDWMNVFEAHAERASSDELRSLWARVFAGEIRKRGSSSLRTLQLFSILDHDLAHKLEAISGFIINRTIIPQITYLSSDPGYTLAITAQSLGLAIPNSVSSFAAQGSPYTYVWAASDHLVRFTAQNAKKYSLSGWALTDVGKEAFSVINSELNQAVKFAFETEIKNHFEPDATLVRVDSLTGELKR